MSHFTVVQVEIYDLMEAAEALKDLGYSIGFDQTLSSHYGERRRAQVSVMHDGTPMIGLVRDSEGKYQLVADWWLVRHTMGIKRDDFTGSFLQRYSFRKVVKEANGLGFRVMNQAVDDQGSIRLEVVRWR